MRKRACFMAAASLLVLSACGSADDEGPAPPTEMANAGTVNQMPQLALELLGLGTP